MRSSTSTFATGTWLLAGTLAVAALQPVALAQEFDGPVGTVRFVSGPTGGTYYPLGAAVAQLLNQQAEDARASSTPTGGSTENARLIAIDEADFGWAAADVAYYGFNGGREFDQALSNLRVVTAGHASAGHMAVRADSEIAEITDLVGKRVGVGEAGSSNAQAASEWLETYGIDDSQVELLYISGSEGINGLRDNNLDAVFDLNGVPSAGWLDVASSHDIRFLPIAEEKMAELNERLPFYVPMTIPAGTYPGVDEDLLTIGVNVVLITSDTVPDQQVYHMLRVMFDYNEELIAAHPNGRFWVAENAATAGFIPFHPGAIAYFEKHGITY